MCEASFFKKDLWTSKVVCVLKSLIGTGGIRGGNKASVGREYKPVSKCLG